MQSADPTPNISTSSSQPPTSTVRPTLRDRPELSVIRVRGEDRVSWLNGQVTNDVRSLAAGASVHALAVNVRGKILAELWVAARGDELLVLAPRAALPALLESFERYIIMEDVELETLANVQVLSLEGPGSAALSATIAHQPELVDFSYDPLGGEGHAWLGSETALRPIREQLSSNALLLDAAAYELTRLRSGQPRFGVDFDDHHYPQEAGLKAHVSFSKGCYLGQEVVCTLENRGRLTRHLCALRGAPGMKLETGATLALPTDPGTAVGTITSAAWDASLGIGLALGYVKRAHAAVGTQLLAGAHALTIEKLVGETDAAGVPA